MGVVNVRISGNVKKGLVAEREVQIGEKRKPVEHLDVRLVARTWKGGLPPGQPCAKHIGLGIHFSFESNFLNSEENSEL